MALRKKCTKCSKSRTSRVSTRRRSTKPKTPRIRNGYKLHHFNPQDQRTILDGVNIYRADNTKQHPKYVQMMIGKSIRNFLRKRGMNLECPTNKATYNLINHPAVNIMLQGGVRRSASRTRSKSRSKVVRGRRSKVTRARSRSLSAAVRAGRSALKRARSRSRSSIMRASALKKRRSASRTRASASRISRANDDTKYMYPM